MSEILSDSTYALDTLKKILPRWVAWKREAITLFSDSAYPLSSSIPKFIGSLVQRFNIRNGRAAKPYRDNIDDINRNITDKLVPAFASFGMTLQATEYATNLIHNKYCLSQIQDFHGLLPKSNDARVPIFDVLDSEIKETGPILDQLREKRTLFYKQFEQLSGEIVDMLGHA